MRKIKGLWKLLFGRTTLLAVFLLLQVAMLVGGFALLDKYVFVFNYILGFVSLLVLLYILNARQNSSFKLTWLMLIIFLPLFGISFYLFTRVQPGTRFISRRIDQLLEQQEPYLAQDQEVLRRMEKQSPQQAGLAKYIHDYGKYPTYLNTQVTYFPLGEDKFRELVRQLEQAKEFIFMEYFIVDKGFMWDTVLEILTRKVREGVEVRFMYDGTCSLTLLPPNYPQKLQQRGINCKVFSRILPFLSTHQNNRDHRKVVVIDGHTAFTGGINLADEYINEIERFGHWKDTAVMVKGEAVRSFTLMFLQMWDIYESEPTPIGKYMRYEFPPREPELSSECAPEDSLENSRASEASGGYVIPYGDSPLDRESVGERVYMDILYSAESYVHIMTPYLILDEEMVESMIYAVKRGVEVKIIMPHIPDKLYAYLLARTYYPELIDAGVEIYEYTPGFVHAKVFTSDDKKAVVGTINLDFRSLYLHFEDAVYMYGNPEICVIEEDFQATLEKCQIITMEDCRNYNVFKKILGRLLRLVAPLM